MNQFFLYFNLGKQHIADLNGIDHILFITALCLNFQWKNWKQMLVLITAFTIGHSITLALSVLNIVAISTKWIEFLIPITILITAIGNLWDKKTKYKSFFSPIYFLTLFFGLIHGLGFSNYLKSLLGAEQNIAIPLLAFNIGLEIGQIIIVCIVLIISAIMLQLIKINRREYTVWLSGGIFFMALQMCFQRIPWQ